MNADGNPKYWSDDLESGNELIDGQHKELLRRFVSLETAIGEGRGLNEVKSVAAFLQRYVLTHFNTEEQDMLSFDYPHFAKHAEEHDVCKTRIFQLKNFIVTEKDKNKILKVALSLVGLWVRDHILNHDIQYIQYGKEKKKIKKIVNIDYHWTPSQSKIWTADMEIGEKNLDEQHQKLVKWTEYTRNVQTISSEELHRLFDFIQGFIYTHFTDEELFMIDIEYPELEKHTQIHREVRAQSLAIKLQMEDTENEERIKPLICNLLQSYAKHIQEIDIDFINYYKNE